MSFLLIARAVRGRLPQSRDLWKRERVGEGVERVSLHAVARWLQSPSCCGFRGVFWYGGISCTSKYHFVFIFLFFERIRPAASMRQPCLIYLSTSTDFESCTMPISTNPGSMEAGECGRTRRTCFIARRLEVVSSPGCCGFRGVFWVRRDFSFFFSFLFLRTHTTCCKYEVALPPLPLC